MGIFSGSLALRLLRPETPGVAREVSKLPVSQQARLLELERVVDGGLDTFLEVARALVEIREQRLYRATHPSFERYVEERFALAKRTAYGYIEAAGVQANLAVRVPAQALSLSQLRALAPLDPEAQRQLAQLIQGLTLTEARRVIRDWRAAQRAEQPAGAMPPLPSGTFRTIVADPPWRYQGNDRGEGLAADQYSTLALEEIQALQVSEVAAPDSHLYLWAPVTKVPDALEVCAAWGFRYVALLTWVKPGLGLGRWWRFSTEHVVFGVRGSLPTRPNLRNYFEAPRGRHSAKPDAFYELVEQASPGPYLELFARGSREDWTGWGLEAER